MAKRKATETPPSSPSKIKKASPEGGDAEKKARPWTAEEDAVYWRHILATYKPDLKAIHSEVMKAAGGAERTAKAIQRHWDSAIRKQLLELAGNVEKTQEQANEA
ncbi:hypothetical protein BCV69DRAFT_297699 [Microstroma glucosiphilum]|uniref:Uncharacterized protein n=1 Tax=Pseudomicrostroma glucosiphilum TaxID=1684307 RepID=A0A316UC10_9BASI|nr:hypothetical protein BCV69DRAFT_297699 [Pseudomicrostroma glucosiphilum]PWN22408.1 hypothetical protein BCV69DRAFT_297699 [Pseudomicrostroma glucosiphilum]